MRKKDNDGPSVAYYCAQGWLKFAEEDVFRSGCQPGSELVTGGPDGFKGETADDVIAECMRFAGTTDPKSVLLDSCDEIGRLDIQVMENEDGTPAGPYELRQWRLGRGRLWLCVYTFTVVRRAERLVTLRWIPTSSQYAEG